MSTGDYNPYNTPQAGAAYVAPPAPPTEYGFEAIRPLAESAWWLKLVGWSFIILGAIQCLTIVGIVIAWLPIWMGFLLKNAGERVSYGQQARNWQSIFDGCKDLKTYFTIMGVLMLINVVILALYIVVLLVVIVVSLVGGAASSM